MAYFYGSLAIVTALLIAILPEKAVSTVAVALLVAGLMALLPEEE